MISIRVLLFACALSVALVHAAIAPDDPVLASSCYVVLHEDFSSSKAASKGGLSKKVAGLRTSNTISTVKVLPKGTLPRGPKKTRQRVRRQQAAEYTYCDDRHFPEGYNYDNQVYIDDTFRGYQDNYRLGWTGPNGKRNALNCGVPIQLSLRNPNGRIVTLDYFVGGFTNILSVYRNPCTAVAVELPDGWSFPGQGEGSAWNPATEALT